MITRVFEGLLIASGSNSFAAVVYAGPSSMATVEEYELCSNDTNSFGMLNHFLCEGGVG
jgi:hypothetical protein